MKRGKVIFLVCIVFAGIIFVVINPFKSKHVTSADNSSTITIIKPLPQSEASEAASMLKKIEGLQIPEAAAKQMVAAYLEWKVAPKSLPYQYWQSSALREANSRVLKHQIDNAKRQALIVAFGSSVIDDPDFAFIFQPYRDKYPFLSAAKQLEVERLAVAVDQALINAGTGVIEAQGTVLTARQAMTDAVKNLLTETEFSQYQLRESPVSKALANNGFGFSQAEFDAMHPVISEGPESVSAPVGVRRLDPKVMEHARTVLGESRFLEYQKAQDPVYHLLSTIALAHGVANSDINTAYTVVYENRQEMGALESAGPILSSEAQRRTQQLKIDLKSKLHSLIGDEAAEIFLRSLDANRGMMKITP